jgi:hypothetical protein
MLTLYVGNRAPITVRGLEEDDDATWAITADPASDTPVGALSGALTWDASITRHTLTIGGESLVASLVGVPYWLVVRVAPDVRVVTPVTVEAFLPATTARPA